MTESVYKKLAQVLDTLPNGFPPTQSGVEIKLLRKVFTPEQAELFCRLRLTFETAEEIARRTDIPVDGLQEKLIDMARAGQVFMIKFGTTKYFRMLPWVFGIYEFQYSRLDKEFALLHEEYAPVYGKQFFTMTPQLMQILPIEDRIGEEEEPLPFEKVSTIIENGQSFLANECICKKEKALLGKPCDRPTQVCLAVAPVPGVFDKSPQGKVLTREEAYSLIKEAEEQGLVHMTSNVQFGPYYICNCCKCCCGVLSAINDWGIPVSEVVNAHYYAIIDPDLCTGCGLCLEERCQVRAIEASSEAYRVIPERCIGCGLCVTTCPTQAVLLKHKDPSRRVLPPATEDAWFDERAKNRGRDYSAYR